MDPASWKLTQVAKIEANHTSGYMLSEVDWGPHDSSPFIYQEHIDHDGESKDFFTPGLRGGLPQQKFSTPLVEYLDDSLDTGQTEDGLYKFKSIQDHRGPYSLSDPEYHGSSCNLLVGWETGEITWEPPTNIMADVKHCGKFNARLVADGHLTKEQLKLFTQDLFH